MGIDSFPSGKAERHEDAPIEEQALADALTVIEERFETGPEDDRLAFHNREHTQGVFRRARAIARVLGMSEHEQGLVGIAAARHDTVQKWDEEVREDGSIVRKRRTKENERASAAEANAWMQEQEGRFTNIDMGLVGAAIEHTTPEWDADASTVSQTGFRGEPFSIARVVMLADLGAAGMEPEVFATEGRLLFREEQLDIVRTISGAKSVNDIPVETQNAIAKRYSDWLELQSAFVRGREERLEEELDGLTEEQQSALRSLFSHFEESIKRAEENVQTAQGMDFKTLAREIVPGAFPEDA